jgi:hypothetical protein
LKPNEVIPDLRIEKLRYKKNRTYESTELLAFDEHLLRRFGLLQLVRKDQVTLKELSVRSVADEFWFLIEGKVQCIARDLREGSPTEGRELAFELSEPSRIMVPFGVAFGWSALGDSALMLRCATHAEGEHPGDRALPIGEQK